ncbi:MAG TPA: M20 family metallopeptidase [Puia sp.]|nr:M20 family metallopeptidase [Puia sp.]
MDTTLFDQLVTIRRRLHQNPELGFKEFETSALVQDNLRALDIPFEKVAETGVIGTMKKGEGPVIVLRADMDALPILENTALPFHSTNKGVMHACGHDLHTTMLLGAAHLLKTASFNGTIKLVFQPSEEGTARSPEKGKSGGQLIMESGLLDGASAALGLHVHPLLPVGWLGYRNGEALTNVGNFSITITGKGGHPGAMEYVVDPVLISAHLMVEAQSIISHTAPLQPAVIAFTHTQSLANPSFNVIPEKVLLQGSLRALNIDTYEKIVTKLRALLKGLEITHSCQIDLDFSAYYPSLLNDPAVHDLLAPVRERIFGKTNMQEVPGQLIGEDFAFFSRAMPSQFYFLGAQGEGNTFYLHHPQVLFNEECIKPGSAFLAQGAIALIDSYRE